MNASFYIAQVMGPYFFLIGLAMILNPARFKAIMKQFQEHQALLSYSGTISLIFGLILVTAHNYWEPEWPLLITILSWFILLKALFRIFFLDKDISFTKKFLNKEGYSWMCWISMIIGGYLIIMGYFS